MTSCRLRTQASAGIRHMRRNSQESTFTPALSPAPRSLSSVSFSSPISLRTGRRGALESHEAGFATLRSAATQHNSSRNYHVQLQTHTASRAVVANRSMTLHSEGHSRSSVRAASLFRHGRRQPHPNPIPPASPSSTPTSLLHTAAAAPPVASATAKPASSNYLDPRILLPLVAAMGVMTAVTIPDTRFPTGPLGTKGGGGGGGGGGGKGPTGVTSSSSSSIKSKSAQKDDLIEEEQAIHRPFQVSVGALQGARWSMEDEYRIANGGRFVACFDGHGGSEVSKYLRDNMYDLYRTYVKQKHWEEEETYRTPSIACHVAALRGALEEIDQRVLLDNQANFMGSTAVAVVVHLGENGERTLLSANVGDSRAVLSRDRKAVNLTRDHKPNDAIERERILAMGEEVQWDPLGHVHRVRSLSLSRAIGDRHAKPVVSGVPEIKHFPLIEDDSNEFVLLASDGLWDVMTSQEAVDFVHESMEEDLPQGSSVSSTRLMRKNMARRVAREAILRGSGDNVCVVMVWLSDIKR